MLRSDLAAPADNGRAFGGPAFGDAGQTFGFGGAGGASFGPCGGGLQVEQAEHWSAWLREQGWQAQVGAGDRIQLQGPGDIPQLLAALCAAGARVHGLTEQSSALLPRYRLALQQLAGAR